MKYQMADIVRFKPEEEKFGLYEVTGYSTNGEITLTNNECNSEFYADENALILVCPAKDRKDITHMHSTVDDLRHLFEEADKVKKLLATGEKKEIEE